MQKFDRDPFFLETSVPGIFAAGDVRHGSVKRVASSVGEGQWPFCSSIDTWARTASILANLKTELSCIQW